MYPPMVPDEDLELEGNKFAFKIFTKALHCILQLDEGIVIEHENNLYVVAKFKDQETGEELVGIDVNPESNSDLKHGMMVWMDLIADPVEQKTDE